MNYILETIWNCFGYTSIEPLRNDGIRNENPVKLSQHKSGKNKLIKLEEKSIRSKVNPTNLFKIK